jgi:DNA-binding beta-propeller fold protein YncE
MKFLFLGVVLTMGLSGASAPGDVLTPAQPMELAGTHGKFDFIKVDSVRHRLLACHTGNGSLDVIDLNSSKLIKSVETGAAQGVAIDDKNGRYFVSVSKPPKLVVIDAGDLRVAGEVPLPAAADLAAYHPATNRVFVCNDTKPEMWVIDPEAKKILTTLTFAGGGMEDLGFDAQGRYLFQNLKESSELAKVDTVADKIVGTWTTAPAEKPHGLAVVTATNDVLIAGGVGKLILLNLTTGQVLASCDIAPRVDEITYDPNLQRAYCAAGSGSMSVVAVGLNKLTTLATIPTSPGAHSIAVDPDTHTVWIVFAKDDKPYVQEFKAN